jgi:hypothetical protein
MSGFITPEIRVFMITKHTENGNNLRIKINEDRVCIAGF